MSDAIEKITEIISPTLENSGYVLVDCEIVFEHGRILRIYMDKKDGSPVTVRDCEVASRNIGDVLDAEDILKGRYILEVSSPGLDRPLKTIDDFKKYCGKTVKIRTKEPIDGRGHYKGTIETVGENQITVMVDNQAFSVPFDMVAKAKLVPEL